MGYLVIGYSIAGIAAALELARIDRPVYLADNIPDSGSIPDNYLIGPTPLNPRPVDADEFSGMAHERLQSSGVRLIGPDMDLLDHPERVDLDETGDLRVRYWDLSGVSATVGLRAAIFSPNGSQPVPPTRWSLSGLFGRGLSCSAWSDAVFFKNQPVIVIGGGCHALAQACIAAESASSVTVLCEQPSIRCRASLITGAAARLKVAVRTGVKVEQILGGAEARVAGVTFTERSGGRVTIAAPGVFLAQEPFIDWSLWGGESRAQRLVRRHKLFPAGIAVGVDGFDHAALFQDGVRAARDCVAAAEAT